MFLKLAEAGHEAGSCSKQGSCHNTKVVIRNRRSNDSTRGSRVSILVLVLLAMVVVAVVMVSQ